MASRHSRLTSATESLHSLNDGSSATKTADRAQQNRLGGIFRCTCMVIEKARELLEPFRDESKRRKPQAIRIARTAFVEPRFVAHANEQAVIHGTRREASQGYRSLPVPKTRHSGGLMAYRRRNVGVRLAMTHLDHIDFRWMIGGLIVQIDDAEYG